MGQRRRHRDRFHRGRGRHRRRRDGLDIEQFSIHEPEEPFAIAKFNSAAAASEDENTQAAAGNSRNDAEFEEDD